MAGSDGVQGGQKQRNSKKKKRRKGACDAQERVGISTIVATKSFLLKNGKVARHVKGRGLRRPQQVDWGEKRKGGGHGEEGNNFIQGVVGGKDAPARSGWSQADHESMGISTSGTRRILRGGGNETQGRDG